MVADKVDVYSKAVGEEQGYKWTSDGYGFYFKENPLHKNHIILVPVPMKSNQRKAYNSAQKSFYILKQIVANLLTTIPLKISLTNTVISLGVPCS